MHADYISTVAAEDCIKIPDSKRGMERDAKCSDDWNDRYLSPEQGNKFYPRDIDEVATILTVRQRRQGHGFVRKWVSVQKQWQISIA